MAGWRSSIARKLFAVLGPHPARPDLRPLPGGVKMLGVTRREQAVHVGLGQADPFLEALVYRTVVLLVTDVGAHQILQMDAEKRIHGRALDVVRRLASEHQQAVTGVLKNVIPAVVREWPGKHIDAEGFEESPINQPSGISW